jgi:hypothetical protein
MQAFYRRFLCVIMGCCIDVALTNPRDYYWYVLHQNGLLIIAYRIEGSEKSILPRQISDGIYLLFLSFFV